MRWVEADEAQKFADRNASGFALLDDLLQEEKKGRVALRERDKLGGKAKERERDGTPRASDHERIGDARPLARGRLNEARERE